MISDSELALLRTRAVVEPKSLVDEIMRLRDAIKGHKMAKQFRYDTPDVILWSHVDDD